VIVSQQIAKGLPKGLPQTTRDGEETDALSGPVMRALEGLKQILWHGHVHQALHIM
jgi:hypothetical protein